MDISKERIQQKARTLGFEPRYLDKVSRLLSCLELIRKHDLLQDVLVLKGGTAINLFHFQLPRLSADIDLNYVGERDVEQMKEKREDVIKSLESVFERADLTIANEPNYDEHAGITWELNYYSKIVGRDNIKVDLNFLMRVPIFPKQKMELNQLQDFSSIKFWTHDLHELAGGKLRALFQRSASRDLYDAYRLLRDVEFKKDWVRIAFLVYGAAARKDWREISVNDINFDLNELTEELDPVLRYEEKDKISNYKKWANELVEGCRQKMDVFLPFTAEEMEFLTRINDHGEIRPELLADNRGIQENIAHNPGLKWKIFNVNKFEASQ